MPISLVLVSEHAEMRTDTARELLTRAWRQAASWGTGKQTVLEAATLRCPGLPALKMVLWYLPRMPRENWKLHFRNW